MFELIVPSFPLAQSYRYIPRVLVIGAIFVMLGTMIFSSAVVQGQSRAGAERPIPGLESVNPLRDIVLPRVIPVIAADVSTTYGDATLINRIFFVTALAMVDAAAPYHPTAVGVYTRFERQPEAARTQRNINVAMLHAAYHALSGMLPERQAAWREMLSENGLNPLNEGAQANSPEAIGSAAGKGAVAGRIDDGMNQRGNYADTTGYAPMNTAYHLYYPSRWQPGMRRQGNGVYTVQHYVTPQLANTEPFAIFDPRQLRVPPPVASDPENWEAYKSQADQVLAVSASLSDEEKMQSELFDNKVVSLTYSFLDLGSANQLSPQDFARGYLVSLAAAMDSSIVIWQEKTRYDGVRPYSAIHYIYGDEPVSAWAGPGRGTAEIPATAWQSYLPEADHPEYPSGSTCGCYAYAQSMRRFFGSDELNWSQTYPAGSSRIEPGLTPASDINLSYATWTDFANSCGEARILGGVHFQAAVDASAATCSVFGDMAYDYYSSLMDGSAPQRAPAQPLEPDPLAPVIAAETAAKSLPPTANSPTPESCERLSDTILVSSPSSAFKCHSLGDKSLPVAGKFIDAVELRGDLDQGVQVCFKKSGMLIFLEKNNGQEAISLMTSYGMGDLTCGWLDYPGIVILASGANPAPAPAPAAILEAADSDDSVTPLTDCRITTTYWLKFRVAPNGASLDETIPNGAQLTAFARTTSWFNVIYEGRPGWISAGYVEHEGDCL